KSNDERRRERCEDDAPHGEPPLRGWVRTESAIVRRARTPCPGGTIRCNLPPCQARIRSFIAGQRACRATVRASPEPGEGARRESDAPGSGATPARAPRR